MRPQEPGDADEKALEALWERVWELKAKALEALPSKVRSLGEAKPEESTEVEKEAMSPKAVSQEDRGRQERPKLKRKSR